MDDGINVTIRKDKPREKQPKQQGDLKDAIEAALGPIRKELAELPRIDAINKLLEDAILKIEEKIEERIEQKIEERIKEKIEEKIDEALAARDSELAKRIEVLESNLVILEHLEQRINDSEQYGRRVCLHFMNIDLPENGEKEDCVEKVGKIIEDLGCGVGANDIDCAHRIGRITTTAEGKRRQQIIVKFRYFRERTLVYRNRKKLDTVKISIDLTAKNLNLFTHARDVAKVNPSVDFVFADINCNLVAKTVDERFLFFNSMHQFYEKLSNK